MQYIDAAMVGRVGAEASASIGLVSTTTWLFWGLCTAAATGFSVQVAHRIGAGDLKGARMILQQSLAGTLTFSLLLAILGAGISSSLPAWLGGDVSIRRDASVYFFIFSIFLPVLQMIFLAGGMLRCSGNMRIPSLLGVIMCVLDVVFNFFLIFPTRGCSVAGIQFTLPGAGLGVSGAALGTAAAETVVAGVLLWYLLTRSEKLSYRSRESRFRLKADTFRKAFRIGFPMGIEHIVICGAQILTTVIVAPLGVFAIAANSFAITAESLCYMPGYGIADAATTLVGQSIGAGRKKLTRSFAHITVLMGMAIMGTMGILMYLFAPQIIGLMTPVEEIRRLGVMALRIEAFAEPMFAASIVAYGVFGRSCRYTGTMPDELLQHLGSTSDLGCLACSDTGIARRMDCHVCGAVFPRTHFPGTSETWTVAERQSIIQPFTTDFCARLFQHQSLCSLPDFHPLPEYRYKS